jgi:hypothetical protein
MNGKVFGNWDRSNSCGSCNCHGKAFDSWQMISVNRSRTALQGTFSGIQDSYSRYLSLSLISVLHDSIADSRKYHHQSFIYWLAVERSSNISDIPADVENEDLTRYNRLQPKELTQIPRLSLPDLSFESWIPSQWSFIQSLFKLFLIFCICYLHFLDLYFPLLFLPWEPLVRKISREMTFESLKSRIWEFSLVILVSLEI